MIVWYLEGAGGVASESAPPVALPSRSGARSEARPCCALGARLTGPDVARDCLLTFLKTPFAGGRHARRVTKMSSPVPQRVP
jgi:Ribose/Galactose Isomerase